MVNHFGLPPEKAELNFRYILYGCIRCTCIQTVSNLKGVITMKRTNVFSALNEVWEERVKTDSLRHLDTSDAGRFLNPNSFPEVAELLVRYSKPRVTVLSPVRGPMGTAIKM